MSRVHRMASGPSAASATPYDPVPATRRTMRPVPSDPLSDLPLALGGLSRATEERARATLLPDLLADPGTVVLDLAGDAMPVQATAGGDLSVARRPPDPEDAERLALFLGRDDAGTAYVAVVHPTRPEAQAPWQTLRVVGERLDRVDAGLFATASALANWHAAHVRCPRCGAPTESAHGGWVRRCIADGTEHYPRSDPAVIMSVLDRDDRLLLSRGATWPERRFSVQAGFVEPGESLEAAVAREVREEVGLDVGEITYLGNQPWPFPASLMVGFTCRTDRPDLRLDPGEIAEARWVSRPEYLGALASGEIITPTGISIAKRIIERWLGHPVPTCPLP